MGFEKYITSQQEQTTFFKKKKQYPFSKINMKKKTFFNNWKLTDGYLKAIVMIHWRWVGES